MSREVAGDTLTALGQNVVAPFHLVRIEFGTGAVYLSEGKTVFFDGETYLTGTVNVLGATWTEQGLESARIELPNYNGSAVSLALNNTIADTPVSVWLTYDLDGVDFATPVLVLKGTLEPSNITDDALVLDVVSTIGGSYFYPNRYCTDEGGFNHLPVSGTVIDWGDEKFLLESE